MAKTVNEAFEEFLRESIRLDTNQTAKANTSRDNLISNINGFSGDDDFFTLYKDRHLNFGSFERKTKIKPLDDIDIMICLSGNGRTYFQSGNKYYITGISSDSSNYLLTDNTNCLNSTKIINRFIKKLEKLSDYRKAEIHKNMEAVTLQMKSYPWNFDIVPCWFMDIDKYLIPDGYGNWKMTDPRIDNVRTKNINQKHQGSLLDVIRIMKYWNNRPLTYRIGSYLLECMILEIYENCNTKESYWIDLEFKDLLNILSRKIMYDVYDPKNIQGNLNTFSYDERLKISTTLSNTYKKACEASTMEINYKDQEGAIKKWREIFGNDFPIFG